MTVADYTILILMGMSALCAAISFSIIARYLFDHGLADRNAQSVDIRRLYSAYLADTRRRTGRIGGVFWVHCIAAGLFISIGVIYTIFRFLLPLVA